MLLIHKRTKPGVTILDDGRRVVNLDHAFHTDEVERILGMVGIPSIPNSIAKDVFGITRGYANRILHNIGNTSNDDLGSYNSRD